MKDPDDIRDALEFVTGGLRPSSGVSNAELTELRRLLVESLRSGQHSGDIGDEIATATRVAADAPDLAFLSRATSDSAGTGIRIVRRSVARGIDAVGPARSWARGMAAERSLGPFVDADGRFHWFDVLRIPGQILVRRGAQNLLVLPAGVISNAAAGTYAIPAGTVWVLANQLASAPEPDAWVGIRVKRGLLRGPAGPIPLNGVLTVAAAAMVDLEIELDATQIEGPAAGPGAEAAATVVEMPASATFVFGPLGADRIDVTPGRLTIYGNELSLTRSAAPASVEPMLNAVIVPMAADADELVIGAVASSMYEPSALAGIRAAGWALPITRAAVESLGNADNAGLLAIALDQGIEARWRGIAAEQAELGDAWIFANPTILMVLSANATLRRGGMTFELWREGDESRSLIEARFSRPFRLWFISLRDGIDAVAFTTSLNGHLDRPILATGRRLPIALEGTIILSESGDRRTFALEAIDQQARGGPYPLALSNALLTVAAPRRWFVNGTLDTDTAVGTGTLALEMPLYQVVPTLPDPYAANFAARRRDAPLQGTAVTSRVTWTEAGGSRPEISLVAPPSSLVQLLPERGRDELDPWLHAGAWLRRQMDRQEEPHAYFWMLDVSSAADQLGVSLSIPVEPWQPGSISVQDLALHAEGFAVQSLLLPQFQWEPVRNVRNVRTGDTDTFLSSSEDGGPAILAAHTVNLVRVAPAAAATALIRAFKEENARTVAKFTLPFGIVARADLQGDGYFLAPHLELRGPRFDTMSGARQISLHAGRRLIEGQGILQLLNLAPLLAGFAWQTENFPGQNPDNSLRLLKDAFNTAFQAEVPITRIDLSGYGANIFSRWLRGSEPDVGITQVSFDAFHGRTAFERVQMVTYLWPCLARMIRTIVFERQGSGLVRRWDSGWVPTSPGLFTLPGKFEHIHPGVIGGLFNIREVQDTADIFTLKSGQVVQAVYYDADLDFPQTGVRPAVVSGQNPEGRVPVRRQLGYIQLVPPPEHAVPPQNPSTASAALLTPLDFRDLLDATGPIGGPVDCVIRVGSSDQKMRITEINTASSRGTGAQPLAFAVSAYGTPVLPAGGRWSMVRIAGDRTVGPTEPRGVPLIRAKGGSHRWADAADLLHEAAPLSDYALLLAHDAQRLIFPRVRVKTGESNLTSDVNPRIADPYRMMRSTGLFPHLDEALDVGQTLALTAGRLELPGGPFSFLPGPQVQSLVNVSAWKDQLDYRNVRFTLDSLNQWQVRIERMEQALSFGFAGEIFRIVHDATSAADALTRFGTPELKFPPALQAVTDVLDMLQQIVPAAMRDGVGPLKFSASLVGTTFRLRAVADLDIADRDGNAIDCGMGKVKGHLVVGAELSAEILKREIHGAVFLEITGSWQQLVFPEIYGGGLLRFSIRADESGKTTFDLDACVVGSVGGDVIPGIIELEATVKYGYFIRIEAGKFLPGIVVGMEGRAKLLSGLLGFKLGVEGRLLLSPRNIPRDPEHAAIHIYGEILVAGTVTVAWLIEERKSFTTSFDVDVDWKTAALIAKAGLLPVP